MQTGRVHVKKSVCEHSCGGGKGRERGVKASVLTSFPSPVKKVLESTDSSRSLKSAADNSGLKMSDRQAREFVRTANTTSWEQYVVELNFLPSFLSELQAKDPAGLYLMETKIDVYQQKEVRTFRRYFASWGAAKTLVEETDLLHFLVVDGCHMKTAFGGVCLAAVVPTANSRIFPLAWAVVDSENEENCAWFAEKIVAQFAGHSFVWMSDQGSALTGQRFRSVLLSNDQMTSLCAKHLIKYLDIAKAKGQIGGTMKGVRSLIYSFARARTRELGNQILAQIGTLSADVKKYLLDRRSEIEAASFLDRGLCRGGRITSQLVESFFGMCDEFRRKGLVSGVIWMAEKFAEVQKNERTLLLRYGSPNYSGTCLKSISMKAAICLYDKSLTQSSFSAELISRADVRVRVSVTDLSKDTERTVEFSRCETGEIRCACGCRFHEEFGLPCGRAAFGLITSGWCDAAGVLPEQAVAKRLHFSTWKAQANVEIVVPSLPPWLCLFDFRKPRLSLNTALKNRTLELFPTRIPTLAGRPKLVSRRKVFSDHFHRIVSATEGGKKRKTAKGSQSSLLESGEDPEIEFDEEIEESAILTEVFNNSDDDSGEEELEDDDDNEDDVVFQLQGPKTLLDLMDNVPARNGKAAKWVQQCCRSCGEPGHKWPSCRHPNVEKMLISLNVLEPTVEEGVEDVEHVEDVADHQVQNQEVAAGELISKFTRKRQLPARFME